MAGQERITGGAAVSWLEAMTKQAHLAKRWPIRVSVRAEYQRPKYFSWRSTVPVAATGQPMDSQLPVSEYLWRYLSCLSRLAGAEEQTGGAEGKQPEQQTVRTFSAGLSLSEAQKVAEHEGMYRVQYLEGAGEDSVIFGSKHTKGKIINDKSQDK